MAEQGKKSNNQIAEKTATEITTQGNRQGVEAPQQTPATGAMGATRATCGAAAAIA